MLSISRILVPVDFSDRCLWMMPYVKAMAEKYKAEITLLHVVTPFYGVPPTGFSGPAMIPISPAILETKQKQLDQFAVSELQGVKVKRFVYEGDTVGQILSFAQSEKMSLVAMPTHGYGVLRRFLIDSVTAKVLHDASFPILTGVHLQEQPTPKTVRFSNILCGIDLGPESEKTLAWASRLAADLGAKLSIVHAIAALNPNVATLFSPDFSLELEKVATKDLEKLLEAVGASAEKFYIEQGEAAKTVCAVAKSAGADLLVIGRGVAENGRLRTNAYAIIRQSPCPVISV